MDFPHGIASVAHAVVVLGLNVVKGLTLCATTFDMMKAAGMDRLWRHSLGVAMTAHILSTRVQMKNPEEVFVAGLLHDIEKVILYVKWPDVGGEVERVAQTKDGFMLEAEQELLELTHADLAGVLATSWHLPVSLREPMMYHHNPTAAQEAVPQTAIVHVVDLLVKGLACGHSGDDLIPPLSHEAWAMLNLSENDLAACLDKAAEEFHTIDDCL